MARLFSWLAQRWVAALLRLYPRAFRRRFAAEMRSTFAERCEEESRRRGVLGLTRLLVRTGWNLLGTALAEHAARVRQRQRHELSGQGKRPRHGGDGFMETLWQDARYGLRMMARQPGFTAVAFLTLALGIGATTAMFSIVYGVLLRPLPYPDPDRLVLLWRHDPTWTRGGTPPVYFRDLESWKEHNPVFEGLAGYVGNRQLEFHGAAGERETITGAMVRPDLFRVLGVQPALGRTFLPEEHALGGPRAILLGHGLWQRRFGGDPKIVGKTITANFVGGGDDRHYLVVGVMPAGFQFPPGGHYWTPGLAMSGLRWTGRLYRVIARLQPGVTLEQARAQMDALSRRLVEEQGAPDYPVVVVPLLDHVVAQVRPALLAFFGAVSLVLLIACANVANLLLGRGATRAREVAIRAALGAGRLRLTRQLLTESLWLFLAGGAAGVLVAYGGVQLLLAHSPISVPRADQIHLDGTVLGFTAAVSLLTGLFFGLIPALRSTRTDLTQTLKGTGGRVGQGFRLFGRNLPRHLLVVSETALALVLLVGAGLLLNSFARLVFIDPGFNPRHLITAELFTRIGLIRTGEPAPGEQAGPLQRELLEQVRTLEGVTSAAVASELPPQGQRTRVEFLLEGQVLSDTAPYAYLVGVSPGYFRTLGIPLLKGRELRDADIGAGTAAVVVNDMFVRRYLAGEESIGKQLVVDGELRQIVGVVGDTLQAGPQGPAEPVLYWPTVGGYVTAGGVRLPGGSHLVVRTVADPVELIGAVRTQVTAMKGASRSPHIAVMDQALWDSIAQPRSYSLLLGIFSCVALLLAAVGLYGVISYSVAQRTREMGVRMALGAQPSHILRMVVREGLGITLIGVVLGLAGAFAATRVLASLLLGVSTADPLTYVVVSLVFLGVALAACYVPARRATRVDPIEALRYE